jgi:predicted TPR repeat methyltransferase
MDNPTERARAWFAEGVSCFEQRDFEAARERFEAAPALAPGRPSLLANLAATQLRLGHPGAALPLLDRLIEAEPNSRDAWCHRAAALAALGRSDEACSSWQRAREIDPRHAGAALQHAIALNDLGRHGQALQVLDVLLAEHGDDARAWAERGHALQPLERAADALAAFERAVAIDLKQAEAWTQRGAILKDFGHHAEAAASFREALAQGGDAELNRFLLASVEGCGAPATPPRRYVQGLFDGYADQFDDHLDQLGFRAPAVLARLLGAGRRFAAALDLGCGTGLTARALASRCATIDGVDVAARMLGRARATGLYRELMQDDVAAYLLHTGERYDLVVAADVFIYVGALDAVFASVARVLRASGLFAFSVEEAGPGVDLGLTVESRYVHSEAYFGGLARKHGFGVAALERATLRHERGLAIAGLFALLER